MALLAFCSPCQDGNHDQHYEVTQAVPEGMIGGARCPCHGECVEQARQRDPNPILTEIAKHIPLSDD